jgi:hypothetical protein
MKRAITYRLRRAQSTIEFAALIIVTAAALIIMVVYLGRGLQQFIGVHADQLGGERISPDVYSPGAWYGVGDSSNVVKRTTWGFDYQGVYGFGVSTRSSQTTSVSSIDGLVNVAELADAQATYDALPSGAEEGLVNRIQGSSYDPGIDHVQQQINNQNDEWHYGYGEGGSGTEELGGGSDDPHNVEGLVDANNGDDPNYQPPTEFSEDELKEIDAQETQSQEAELEEYL